MDSSYTQFSLSKTCQKFRVVNLQNQILPQGERERESGKREREREWERDDPKRVKDAHTFCMMMNRDEKGSKRKGKRKEERERGE